MKRILTLTAAAAVIIVSSGLVHGWLTDRWGSPDKLKSAAAKLESVPSVIGDWEATDYEIPERQLELAEAVGSLSRTYVNRVTGATVNVLALCGRPGPISVHPPTVCFTGAGFVLGSEPQRFALESRNSKPLVEFWLADFFKPTESLSRSMQTFWSWNGGDGWRVPDNPRLTFARYQYSHLYKLYVTHEIVSQNDPVEDSVAVEFMRTFIPELNQALFATQLQPEA